MTGVRRFLGITFGVIFGTLGGFLIYMEAGILVGIDKISPVFAALLFLGLGVLVTTLVLRRTKTLTKVFTRGFLIGAANLDFLLYR